MAGYEDFAFFYDKLSDINEYSQRCDYLTNLLSERNVSGGILLDLACGTGVLSQMFSEKGYDVIGVDVSEDMLSIAMKNNFEKNGNVQYLCQNMAELDLFGTINCAICTLDSINHVTDKKEVEKAIEKVGLFMEKGGYFIFDVNTLHKHRDILGNNTFVYDTDDVYCVWLNELDKNGSTVHISLDLFAKNDDSTYNRYEEDFDEVIYEDKWLIERLINSGFAVREIYNDLSKEPANDNSERKIFVCEKIINTNAYYEEKE